MAAERATRPPAAPAAAIDRRLRSALSSAWLRGALLQAGFAALLIIGAWWVVDTTLTNLSRLGITTGFAFLGRPAGFDIAFKLVDFDSSHSYARAFLVGLLNTLLVSLLAAGCGTLLGFAVGVLRVSGSWLMERLCIFYVEALRNCPLLLQLFVWYFAVIGVLPQPRQSLSLAGIAFLNNRGLFVPRGSWQPDFWPALAVVAAIAVLLAWCWRTRRRAGIALALVAATLFAAAWGVQWDIPVLAGFNFRGGVNLVPEFFALLLALSVYLSAFVAEIVRAGIAAVPHGQIEAGYALGLSRRLVRRFVILPLALRAVIPPLANQYVNVAKYSSLAAAIAYPDLMQVFGKTTLNQTGQAIEVITLTMLVYLAISLGVAGAMHLYNQRVALAGAERA